MRPRHLLIASLLAAAPLGPAGAQQPRPVPETPTLNSVAAIVNGKVITRNEVEMAAKYQLMLARQGVNDPKTRQEREHDALVKGLGDLVDRELVISEFERMGAKIKPQYVDEDIQRLIRENFNGSREGFLRQLKLGGISWPKFREQHQKTLVVAAMRGHATNGVGFPTPEEKEEFFRKNEANFREEGSVWMKTIAIPQLTGDAAIPAEEQRSRQRRLANEIRRRLVDGADFASEAKTYSQDSQAAKGGDWGTVTRTTLAPQLADVAFSVPVKTISPVFEFRGYYYIMNVEERKLGKLKPQAEIDELLDKLVQAEAKKKVMDEYMAKLRKQATIAYPDPSLRPPERSVDVRPALGTTR